MKMLQTYGLEDVDPCDFLLPYFRQQSSEYFSLTPRESLSLFLTRLRLYWPKHSQTEECDKIEETLQFLLDLVENRVFMKKVAKGELDQLLEFCQKARNRSENDRVNSLIDDILRVSN